MRIRKGDLVKTKKDTYQFGFGVLEEGSVLFIVEYGIGWASGFYEGNFIFILSNEIEILL